MTKEEILKMEAGKELNVLIAENVFGWIKNDLGFDVWYDGNTYTSAIKDYSTEISVAWEIMQKFRNPVGVRVAFGYFIKEIAEIERNVELHDMSVMWSLTPVNICKAALLNVMDLEEIA